LALVHPGAGQPLSLLRTTPPGWHRSGAGNWPDQSDSRTTLVGRRQQRRDFADGIVNFVLLAGPTDGSITETYTLFQVQQEDEFTRRIQDRWAKAATARCSQKELHIAKKEAQADRRPHWGYCARGALFPMSSARTCAHRGIMVRYSVLLSQTKCRNWTIPRHEGHVCQSGFNTAWSMSSSTGFEPI
jgi:hypothetical protein